MKREELIQNTKQDAIDIREGFYQPSYTMIEEELAPGCYLYRLVPNEEKQERIRERLEEAEETPFLKRLGNFIKRPFTFGSE